MRGSFAICFAQTRLQPRRFTLFVSSGNRAFTNVERSEYASGAGSRFTRFQKETPIGIFSMNSKDAMKYKFTLEQYSISKLLVPCGVTLIDL